MPPDKVPFNLMVSRSVLYIIDDIDYNQKNYAIYCTNRYLEYGTLPLINLLVDLREVDFITKLL